MAYTKRLVCLANSYKKHGTCVAGVELTPAGYGPWIRPVSGRPSTEVSLIESYYQGCGVPKPLDILDIPLLRPLPGAHQSENHLIAPGMRWKKVGDFPFSGLASLCEAPLPLWSNTEHTQYGRFDCLRAADAASHRRSLVLIQAGKLQLRISPARYSGARQYRAKFTYAGTDYSLSVTDPAARRAFEICVEGEYDLSQRGMTYLCVSLTEPFPEDDRCHKIVATILTDAPLRA